MNTLQMTKGYEHFDKTLVKQMAKSFIEEAENGNIDVLSSLAHLEFMSQVIEMAKEELRVKAISVLDSYGTESKSGVVKHGVTFKIKEAGVKYDYKNTKPWNELKIKEDAMAAERKSLEEKLKTLSQKMTILDEETGELIEMFPPIKSSKTTVEISLAK